MVMWIYLCCFFITLRTNWADDKLMKFVLVCSEKKWHLHANCFLMRQFAWNEVSIHKNKIRNGQTGRHGPKINGMKSGATEN